MPLAIVVAAWIATVACSLSSTAQSICVAMGVLLNFLTIECDRTPEFILVRFLQPEWLSF